MRIIVNSSGLFVILTIIVLIHTSVINKSIRDMEVNYGLQSSMDYALDVMGDVYENIDYEESKDGEYTQELLDVFCKSLTSMIGTDGEISVSIVEADVKTGTFQIVVEEHYKYAFRGRPGYARCERAVVLG
ncbi:MAG: hypothetical protein IJB96_03450 [Lachnospira sp.]|nr:hypothetical protein [Lachnospira sp.]